MISQSGRRFVKIKQSGVVIITILLIIWAISCSDDGISDGIETLAYVGGYPDGVTISEGTGNVYITDIGSETGTGSVKRIDGDGAVTTILETGLTHPDGIVAVTESGKDVLYVTNTGTDNDSDGNGEFDNATDGTITRITIDELGTVTSSAFVDTTVIDNPTGIAADASGDLYVADQKTNSIILIPVDGDGNAGVPQTITAPGDLGDPHGLTLVNNADSSVTLYTTDQGLNTVVKIDVPASGPITVTTVAGDGTADGGFVDGTGSDAKFDRPHGVSRKDDGTLVVADEVNDAIRFITPSGNVITYNGNGTLGSSGESSGVSGLNNPRGIATDTAGNVLICDYGNAAVKKIKAK